MSCPVTQNLALNTMPMWKLQVHDYLQIYMAKGDAQASVQFRPRPACEWCGIVRRGISARQCCICIECNAAHYCSQQCRRLAWHGGHWAACGPATKMRPGPSDPACPGVVEDEA